MPFDLVIKNGMVVDGSGLPAYPADIGVRHGRIDTIGRIRERAREGIDAGAVGFTTSRSPSHETPDGRPVASRAAAWDEVRRLVGAMGELNAGIFELAGENVDRVPDHPALRDYHVRLRNLAVETGRPVTFGVFSRRGVPGVWKKYMDLLDETAAAGGRMFAQPHSRSLSALPSFKTQMPFDWLPLWNALRQLPPPEQRPRLGDPATRKKLVEVSGERDGRRPLGTEPKPPDYDWLLVFDTVEGPHRTVAEVARERGQHPAETTIELALEKD